MFKRLFASPINAAKEKVEEYLELKMEAVKISAVQKASPIVSGLIIGVLALFFILLILVFLAFGAAIWIGQLIESSVGGYLIVAGVFLLFTIILLMLSSSIKKAVANAMAKMI